MITYNKDSNNYINYELHNNHIIVKFLFYYDIETLEDALIFYYQYLSTKYLNFDFLTTYPGTTNPYVVEYHLSAMDKLNLKYKVHLDGLEIKNVNKFRKSELRLFINSSKNQLERNQKQSTCSNQVSQFCKSLGMGMCSITTTLRETNLEVVSPIKYYTVDADGFLISEHDSKPLTERTYHSIRLSDKFQNYKIRLVDGSPRFYPKD